MCNKTYSELWDFIEANLPCYYTRDDVLYSDILLRYICDEEVYEKDLVWIEREYDNDKEAIKKELIRLESQFAAESIENYYRNL